MIIKFILTHLMNRPTSKKDCPLSWRKKSDDVLQQHALAGSAFPNDGRDLAIKNPQIYIVKDCPFPKPFGHIFEFNQ